MYVCVCDGVHACLVPVTLLTAMPILPPQHNTDDLGYNELNFMNNTRGILTPHLDALANKGAAPPCVDSALLLACLKGPCSMYSWGPGVCTSVVGAQIS